MTRKQFLSYRAAYLLALCASGRGETLQAIAMEVGVTEPDAILLARRALVASLGCGRNWRESRAEAEAKLRTGERIR
jgi:hypothetical protein